MIRGKIGILLLGVYAVLMIALSIIGGFRSFSPVPYWDMWNGYLDFFIRASHGDYGVWWSQHNEHRIVLSRLLFWMDLRWFGGIGAFLVPINYVFTAIAGFIFCQILVALNPEEKTTLTIKALCILIFVWMMLWVQSENLISAFQSQFILAQLLPLCAFFWAYKSISSDQRAQDYSIACLLGVLSVGTMANGILALPLLTLYAIVSRQSLARIGVYLFLSILSIGVYFYGYTNPEGHGSILAALRENPLGLLKYVLTYLGSPFYYFLEGVGQARNIAMACGGFLILSAVIFLILVIKRRQEKSLQLALLFFLLYIGGTALGTAGGRLILGLEQALSGRYTTPALMAWGSILILYSPWIVCQSKMGSKKFSLLLILLCCLPIPSQLSALSIDPGAGFERTVAGLALELGIKDRDQVGKVFPSLESSMLVAKNASEQKFSIFGRAPLLNLHKEIGGSIEAPNIPLCVGNLDEIIPLYEDSRYIKVRGWLFHNRQRPTSQLIRFVNSSHEIVGFALDGQKRMDVSLANGKEAQHSGYLGYLLRSQLGSTVTLIKADNSCQLQTIAPNISTSVYPFVMSEKKPAAFREVVSDNSISEGNQWLGSDFDKSNFEGMRVYGSFINSDADTGSVSLRINRTDRLFYRSGPAGGHQVLEIPGIPPIVMPTVSEWRMLDFSGQDLPKGKFEIKFSDNGSGWGEWSAISVVKSSK